MSAPQAARAPRVLVSGVVLGQPLGGVVRHNAALLPRLAARLTADGGALAVLEGRVPIEFPLPREVERIASDVPWLPTVHRALHEGRALARALAAAAERGAPFDLVHFGHHPVPRGLGVPYTLTAHDLRSLDMDRAPFVRRLLAPRFLQPAFRGARKVFTVSEATRARIVHHFGLDSADITLVPNGVECERFLPRRTGAPYLLHVGHLEPRKDLGLLLAALAHAADLPRLVIAGLAKGDEAERLAALAGALQVRERVELLGAVADQRLLELYAGAAAVVLPSRLEGFGIVALEALAAGAPLAASDLAAHREVAGDAAEWFAVGDVAGCIAAVRRALGHGPSEAERGRARAAGCTWERAADAWYAGTVAAQREPSG